MDMLNLKRPVRSLLAGLLMDRLPQDGRFDTAVPELTLIRRSQTSPRGPVVYQPSIFVVAQGCKQAYCGDQRLTYDAFNFLVLAVPLPLEAHVIRATPEEPYLALRIALDLAQLNELILSLDAAPTPQLDRPSRGIFVSPVDAEFGDAIYRLIKSLDDPQSARVLGPMIVREILFHVLRGEQGGVLRSFARQDRHNHQIARVLNYIQSHYGEPLEIQDLAAVANMSTSSLHAHFKVVTESSPLQYIKNIRLHEARRIIQQDAQSIGDAAFRVGYSSASQFSREYKRLFGETPSRDGGQTSGTSN